MSLKWCYGSHIRLGCAFKYPPNSTQQLSRRSTPANVNFQLIVSKEFFARRQSYNARATCINICVCCLCAPTWVVMAIDHASFTLSPSRVTRVVSTHVDKPRISREALR